jgi:hypothetical protein
MYYRLFDRQTGCLMATGYNDKSKKQLSESYLSYKSVDIEDGDEDFYKKLSTKEIINLIEQDEFTVEKSKNKFSEKDNPMNF